MESERSASRGNRCFWRVNGEPSLGAVISRSLTATGCGKRATVVAVHYIFRHEVINMASSAVLQQRDLIGSAASGMGFLAEFEVIRLHVILTDHTTLKRAEEFTGPCRRLTVIDEYRRAAHDIVV